MQPHALSGILSSGHSSNSGMDLGWSIWQWVIDVVAASLLLSCAISNAQRDRIVYSVPSSTISLWPILLSLADSTLPPTHSLKSKSRLTSLSKRLGLYLISHQCSYYPKCFSSCGPWIMDVNESANSFLLVNYCYWQNQRNLVSCLSAVMVLLVTFHSLN